MVGLAPSNRIQKPGRSGLLPGRGCGEPVTCAGVVDFVTDIQPPSHTGTCDVIFASQINTPPGQNIVGCQWSFGSTNCIAASHTFSGVGPHNVTLTVQFTDYGCEMTKPVFCHGTACDFGGALVTLSGWGIGTNVACPTLNGNYIYTNPSVSLGISKPRFCLGFVKGCKDGHGSFREPHAIVCEVPGGGGSLFDISVYVLNVSSDPGNKYLVAVISEGFAGSHVFLDSFPNGQVLFDAPHSLNPQPFCTLTGGTPSLVPGSVTVSLYES